MKRFFLVFIFCFPTFIVAQLPKGFVYLEDEVPNIKIELRYCLLNNFVGSPIDGYEAEVCIVSKPTALALKKVQEALAKKKIGLKVFDAYRPQQAVNHFIRWAKNVNDTLMKQAYYPNVDKRNLFRLGYIASRSRHSSGSTVDVSLINLITGEELDMGTPYDFFGEASWYNHENLTTAQKENRALLHTTMLANGFRHYPKEWWHFTLRGEPYRNQYFNFLVE